MQSVGYLEFELIYFLKSLWLNYIPAFHYFSGDDIKMLPNMDNLKFLIQI